MYRQNLHSMLKRCVCTVCDSDGIEQAVQKERRFLLSRKYERLGNVGAIICDHSVVTFQQRENPDVFVQLSQENDITMERYAVGFKKGETELAATVTATLKEMTEDRTMLDLSEKYAEYGLAGIAGVLEPQTDGPVLATSASDA